MKNKKLMTFFTIVPLTLGFVGTGFGVWVFSNNNLSAEAKAYVQIDSAVKVS